MEQGKRRGRKTFEEHYYLKKVWGVWSQEKK